MSLLFIGLFFRLRGQAAVLRPRAKGTALLSRITPRKKGRQRRAATAHYDSLHSPRTHRLGGPPEEEDKMSDMTIMQALVIKSGKLETHRDVCLVMDECWLVMFGERAGYPRRAECITPGRS